MEELVQVLLEQQEEDQGAATRQELEDPVKFIIRTWPWTHGAQGLPQVPRLALDTWGSGAPTGTSSGTGHLGLRGSHRYLTWPWTHGAPGLTQVPHLALDTWGSGAPTGTSPGPGHMGPRGPTGTSPGPGRMGSRAPTAISNGPGHMGLRSFYSYSISPM